MKKSYVPPNLEVLRIKQGNVVMNSRDFDCRAEGIGGDGSHVCDPYCEDMT